ncbi:MAG: SDR family oxidoreductase [Novosphingobium sp.]|nr:SDR family oxidoreductase [Novosphingobium sp.]
MVEERYVMSAFLERRSYLAEAPVALIVGCGDMGMGSARALGRRHPLLLADIDEQRLAEAVATLRHEGYVISGMACDITSAPQVKALADHLATRQGIRALIHVAAIGNNGADWRRVLDVDLVGAAIVAETMAPLIVRGGVAIFISSTGAQRCPRDDRLDALLDDPLHPELADRIQALAGREPNFLEAYFMAKRGMNRMAERLAIAWGPREVRALSVSPGLIDSTMGRTSGAVVPIHEEDGSERLGTRTEKALIEVPLGRQGSILDVIATVDFLASDAACFINGIDLPVDGGAGALWRQRRPVSPSLDFELLAPSSVHSKS